ncbi:hypothetical protein CCM_08426 [Cordyceps militaris CM01]|uniref:Uncharacterized protein n=1 Tax=Cordyceps militaris (strain CM01) TaxID=983644 RepID=G3JR87_CORMM|nr:uncharacterized protein CCM_08426 [Cordyceps militaris CM01]EGX88383.1 hypothetical protein CCM_08426 [Cordyceps militaris CM01]
MSVNSQAVQVWGHRIVGSHCYSGLTLLLILTQLASKTPEKVKQRGRSSITSKPTHSIHVSSTPLGAKRYVRVVRPEPVLWGLW